MKQARVIKYGLLSSTGWQNEEFLSRTVSGFEGFNGIPLPKLPFPRRFYITSISFGKANQGPTSVITSCQDTFVNWTCVHGPIYIVAE